MTPMLHRITTTDRPWRPAGVGRPRRVGGLGLLVWSCLVVLLVGLCGRGALGQSRSSENDPRLQRYLEQHPEADTDGDGVLTDFEQAGHLPRSILDQFARQGRHLHFEVAMRDGVKLATEVFLPAGDGPWPVVLMRTPYGRWNTGGYAKRYAGDGVGFVVQDLRGAGDSKGKGTYDPADFTVEIQDSKDTVAWLAGQSWCNGRVGMTGGSGHGMAAALAYWSKAPDLVATMPGNTAGHGRLYWLAHNGVRRHTYDWITHRGGSRAAWPRPTLCPVDRNQWLGFIAEQATGNPIFYSNSTGWFDPLCQGALDDFAAIARAGGRAYVVVAPRGHGGLSGLKYPDNYHAGGPGLVDLLKRPDAAANTGATLAYYLMGDVRDPEAPGNQWKLTDHWPVAHDLTPWYLQDKSLTGSPASARGHWQYTYDPANPAPSIGGHYTWSGDKSGPHDQRPLLERDDVRLFTTPPLTEPLTITGPLKARLFVSSDAPDSLFVVKLIDIYPDGYHALIRESAAMARFGDDSASQAPLARNEIRSLTIDMWSTAYAFNRGHRIGVLVTSSSDPAYQVHPNRYDPIDQADQAHTANNTIHWSTRYPSQVVLPVVRQAASSR